MSAQTARSKSKTTLHGWRLAVLRAGLAVGGLFFAFLVLEVGLRIVNPRIPTSTVLSMFFEYDAATGWRGQPNAQGSFVTANFDSSVSHDADGWRRSAITAPIDDDTHAPQQVVWCVGDSMTWGWGVSDGETFVDQLNRQAGPHARYRNLGIPGYSTVQEYLLLKQQFELGRVPDRVVVFFCANDWEGNIADPRRDPPQPWAACRDGVWTIEGSPVPKTFGWTARSWLRRNSLAFAFLNYHYKRARQARQPTAISSTGKPQIASVYEPSEAEQQAMKFAYGKVQDLCREHQVELFVATDFLRHPAMERICGELDIPLISAVDQRPADYDPSTTARDQALTFATDPHWTVRGHSLVARAIRDGLDTSPTVAQGRGGNRKR